MIWIGVAILYKKSLRKFLNIIAFNDNRIVGFEFGAGLDKILALCVYLPYEFENNFAVHIEYLGKLKNIIDDFSGSNVVIAGDFNADLNKKFGCELYIFAQYYN